MLATLRQDVSSGIVRRSPRGANMSAFILLVIAAVVVAAFWRTILKIGIAAVIIGFIFLFVTGLLEILHGLHSLIP
jgi:uncharacterized membrane protein YGL010W